MKRLHGLLLAGLLAGGSVALPALAQNAGPPSGESRGQEMVQKFRDANTTHDGKLTLQQAEAANLGPVVKHFSDIDKQNRGYITLPEIRAYAKQMRAQHGGGGGGPSTD